MKKFPNDAEPQEPGPLDPLGYAPLTHTCRGLVSRGKCEAAEAIHHGGNGREL